MESLEFYLKGKESPGCDLGDVGAFAAQLNESLRRICRVLEPGRTRLPRFEVSDVKSGSIKGVVRTSGLGLVGLVAFVQSIEALRHSVRPDYRLSGDDIRALKKLADPLSRNLSQIVIGDTPIDQRFIDGCNTVLNQAPKSLGQATGRLEAVSTHTSFVFRLYEFDSDRGIECFFSEKFYPIVLENMRKRVRVEGLIHRDPDGLRIDRVTDIAQIERLPENDELPTLSSLFGQFAGTGLDVRGRWEDAN